MFLTTARSAKYDSLVFQPQRDDPIHAMIGGD